MYCDPVGVCVCGRSRSVNVAGKGALAPTRAHLFARVQLYKSREWLAVAHIVDSVGTGVADDDHTTDADAAVGSEQYRKATLRSVSGFTRLLSALATPSATGDALRQWERSTVNNSLFTQVRSHLCLSTGTMARDVHALSVARGVAQTLAPLLLGAAKLHLIVTASTSAKDAAVSAGSAAVRPRPRCCASAHSVVRWCCMQLTCVWHPSSLASRWVVYATTACATRMCRGPRASLCPPEASGLASVEKVEAAAQRRRRTRRQRPPRRPTATSPSVVETATAGRRRAVAASDGSESWRLAVAATLARERQTAVASTTFTSPCCR